MQNCLNLNFPHSGPPYGGGLPPNVEICSNTFVGPVKWITEWNLGMA